MDREQRRRGVPPPLSGDSQRIADRLQELTVDEAERILERAIQLQSSASGDLADRTLDTEMLGRIADELDIDRRHLRQALAEELFRVETEAPGGLDRILGPATMTVQGSVPGDIAEVRDTVDAWMINHEGFRKRAETSSTTRWEKDQGFGAVVRRHLQFSRGRPDLRSAAGITTSVRPATDDHQVVMIEADTTNLRRLAVGLLAGAVVLGGATAAVSAGIDTFGPDDVAVGAAIAGVVGGGVLIGFRMWAERIRDGLVRAVEAIGSPHLVERGTSVPSAVRRFVDTLRNATGVERRDRRNR